MKYSTVQLDRLRDTNKMKLDFISKQKTPLLNSSEKIGRPTECNAECSDTFYLSLVQTYPQS